MGRYGGARGLVVLATMVGVVPLACGGEDAGGNTAGQSSSGGTRADGGSGGGRAAMGGGGTGVSAGGGGTAGQGQGGGPPGTGGSASGGRASEGGSSGSGGLGEAGASTETGGSAGAPGGAGGGPGEGGAAGAGEPPPGLIVPLFKAARSVGPSGSRSLSTPVDLDGDGWLDLAWAERGGPGIMVAVNDRAGGFHGLLEPLSSSEFNGPPAFGDVNGDGHPDAAVAAAGSSLRVALGRGDGTFEAPLSITTDISAGTYALGELDGDRKADLVLADRRVGPMPALLIQAVFDVGGSQGKTTLTLDEVSSIPLSILIRDLDADDDQDVLLSGFTDTYWLRNDGTGVLSEAGLFPVGEPIAVADFDGDGRLDLSGYGTPGVTILLGREGGFAEPVAKPAVCSDTSHVVVGDVDGDERPDFVCSGATTRVHLNLGQGKFGSAQELVGVGRVELVVDWDHDDDADIVADGGTTVFFNDDGTLPERASPQPPFAEAGSGWRWATSVELNGDDVADVVLASGNSLNALFSGSNGVLGTETRLADLAFMGPPGVGDVDGDGSADLVLPYGDPGGRIGVALNDGKGTFGAETFFVAGSYPTAVELVDLNDDGERDAVALVAAGLSVLLNDGAAGFPTHVEYEIADVRALATADVNGDGAPDIVTVGPAGTYVSRNQGDGTFAPAVSYPHGGWTSPSLAQAPSSALTLVDLTGDDKPEIALALEGDILVHRNRGNGTFGGVIRVVGRDLNIPDDPWQPHNLVAGDLNGDGVPDLVALYGGSTRKANITRTFFNDGQGTLWRGEVYALTPSPVAVATRDLDGDGRVDIER